jgi:5-methylcytosine-specific restriction protein A
MTTHDPSLNRRAYRRTARMVIDRDLGLCQIHGPNCGVYATCVDHIIDRADGGDDHPTNLRAACKACNSWRAAQRTNQLRYHTDLARYQTRL